MAVENKTDALFVIWNQSDAIVGYSGKINGEYKADVAVQPNTDYAKGELRCGFVSYNEEKDENEVILEIVDVPAFKTKPILVSGVTIAPKTASVNVGATTKLNSTIAPSNATNKSVSYKSSDNAIATVSSDGTVTGVAEGTATITVTSQEGNKSDTAILTITAAVAPAE